MATDLKVLKIDASTSNGTTTRFEPGSGELWYVEDVTMVGHGDGANAEYPEVIVGRYDVDIGDPGGGDRAPSKKAENTTGNSSRHTANAGADFYVTPADGVALETTEVDSGTVTAYARLRRVL